MRFLKWTLLILISIPIIFVVGFYIRNKLIGPIGWAEENTIKELKLKMKDPDSLVIRSSFFVQKVLGSSNHIHMCGIVDGKNAFGGYTGGSRFASKSVSNTGPNTPNTFETITVVMENAEIKSHATKLKILSSFEKVYWNDFCVDDNHPPLTPGN